MADKKYTAIFVPHELRDRLKAQAAKNGRSMIDEVDALVDNS